MGFGSSNMINLRLIKEASFGVTPGSGNPNNLRNTGDDLSFSLTKTESAERNSDRMTSDLIVTGAGATGPVNFELSYKEFDMLLEAALMSAGWTYYGVATAGVGQGVGTQFTSTTTASTITASVAPTGSSALTTLQKGQWFQIQSPGNLNHGKWFRVHSTTAPTSTVVTVDPATPLQAESAKPYNLSSARISNGANQVSFSIERHHTDINKYFHFRGMTLSKMSLSIASGAVVTGSFEFMGKDGQMVNATLMPGTPVASSTYDVMNGVTGVGTILEGGIALAGTKIKKVDLSIDNTLRAQDALGELGAAGIGMGSFKVTGNIETYLVDGTLYDKFVNNTASSLQVPVIDGAKNGYVLQLPKLKYGDAKVTSGSKDSDCMISIPFTALRDDTAGQTGKALLVDRFGV